MINKNKVSGFESIKNNNILINKSIKITIYINQLITRKYKSATTYQSKF